MLRQHKLYHLLDSATGAREQLQGMYRDSFVTQLSYIYNLWDVPKFWIAKEQSETCIYFFLKTGTPLTTAHCSETKLVYFFHFLFT